MCGIAGIIGASGTSNIPTALSFMLDREQHRGYDGAGAAYVYHGSIREPVKNTGLVYSVFDKRAITRAKCDLAAIGQVRYATVGLIDENGTQPFKKCGNFEIALSHNGQIEYSQIRDEIEASGGKLDSTSDSEVIAHLIANSRASTVEDAIIETCGKINGSYSLLILTPDKMIAVRDPHGIRPLSFSRLVNSDGNFHIAASETCALTGFGRLHTQEVEPGTMVVFDERGWRMRRFAEAMPKLCLFEIFYLSRPDSYLLGRPVRMLREALGVELARYCQEKGYDKGVDCIIPIPESGVPAAIGYHKESGIPYEMAFTANRTAKRLFMHPNSAMRAQGARGKQSLIPEYVDGKSIIVVDDTVVRGDTSGELVMYLKECGAREVHLRIPAPPIKYPCFYGIDIATRKELIASQMNIESISGWLHAESLVYLLLDRIIKVLGLPRDNFCHACMTGEYPIALAA